VGKNKDMKMKKRRTWYVTDRGRFPTRLEETRRYGNGRAHNNVHSKKRRRHCDGNDEDSNPFSMKDMKYGGDNT
jgi:hypothetical protein